LEANLLDCVFCFTSLSAEFQFAAQLAEEIEMPKKARMKNNLNIRNSKVFLYD